MKRGLYFLSLQSLPYPLPSTSFIYHFKPRTVPQAAMACPHNTGDDKVLKSDPFAPAAGALDQMGSLHNKVELGGGEGRRNSLGSREMQTWFPNFSSRQNHLRAWLGHMAGPWSSVSHSGDLGWGQIICISNKFQSFCSSH